LILSAFRAKGAVLALVIAASVVAACGGGAATPGSSGGKATSDGVPPQAGELPEIEIHAAWAWGDAEDLATLAASADTVFRGKVVAFKGQHPALSPSENTQAGGPVPRWADFPISQFEVRVEKVVTGPLQPGSTVTFEQAGGVQTRPDGTAVKLVLEQDELVEPGEKYLFFAKIREDGVLEAAPFARMKVSDDAQLSAGKGWGNLKALQQLSRLDVDRAEREISAAAGN